MQAVSDYLSMGGYAAFIWPAYGIAALILIAFALDSWLRLKRAAVALRRLEAAQATAKPADRRKQHPVLPA